jgi:hypothetical protein
MAKAWKPILVLDFDGVLHSYTSGWQGARTISDPPVPGALQFLAESMACFKVAILSSRSHQFGGRRAMKQWLRKHFMALTEGKGPFDCPQWLYDRVLQTAFADPWEAEVRHAVECILKDIAFPLFKPSASVTIDDRAIQFTGTWPSLDELRAFKPWNKRKTVSE